MAPPDPGDLALFQPDKGLWIAPIRHHSPACAWAVRAMIRDVRPDAVLIEGPADLMPLVPEILDPRTKPPIATVTLHNGQAAYAPFTTHSPEYVAMQTAQEVGASLQLIDLPTDRFFERDDRGSGSISMADEALFDDGDYIAALCARTGNRDGFELWDHLFEARLGELDWKAFLTDVGTYCHGLRLATPQEQICTEGHERRETAMSAHIAHALTQGRVVVVVGGFHAPALTAPVGKAPVVPKMRDSYLIRYGHAAMDALSGYSAGLPQPGFYDALWQAAEQVQGEPDWNRLGADLLQRFAHATEQNGFPMSFPAKTETVRMATALARLRGRQAVTRHDFFDAVQSALSKVEVSGHNPWVTRLEQHWRGHALGKIPNGLSAPPLIEDARRLARKHRLDISDSLERNRSLDIHRKPRNLDASRFLHAMDLLDVGFAQMLSGPDYVNGRDTDRLFENWQYAWTAAVETRLLELAIQGMGASIEEACLSRLHEKHDADLVRQTRLLAQGIRAGLGPHLRPFVDALAVQLGQSGGLTEISKVLRQLFVLCTTRGPMQPPGGLNLPRLLQVCYNRLIYLTDDLPDIPEDMVHQAVGGLRLVTDLLMSDTAGLLDRQRFDDAIQRLTDQTCAPEITGAVLALALRSGHVPASRLTAALSGSFLGVALSPQERLGVVIGTISAAPMVLWQVPEVLKATDSFIASVPEDTFLQLLPTLRRVFTTLNPREADTLARALKSVHGLDPMGSSASNFTERDLAIGLAAQKAMADALVQDGLEDAP